MLNQFEAQVCELTQEDRAGNFRLVHVGDLIIRAVSWLIFGLVEKGGLVQIFGDPGSFKSFLAIAWACCVASKVDFCGRAVKGGPVVYIAGEGQNGLARRFKAWAIRNHVNLKDIPLFVSQMPAGLCDAEQARFVLDEVNRVAKLHGSPALIVIDTVARNFGPGDENSTKDMSGFIQACDLLRCEFEATILLIHHSGHTDKSRARGAMALKGALDSEYRIDKDEFGIIRLEPTKMKDAEYPNPMAFKAAVVELGIKDEMGNQVTSVVLDETAYEPAAKPGKKGRGKWQTFALEVFEKLQTEREYRLSEKGFNAGTARVSVEDWKTACFDKGMHRETWRRMLKNPPPGVKIHRGFVENA